MKQHRDSYRVCVVTNALTKPQLEDLRIHPGHRSVGKPKSRSSSSQHKGDHRGPMLGHLMRSPHHDTPFGRSPLGRTAGTISGLLATGWSIRRGSQQIAIMQQVALGDRVILKRGLGQILAAGVVVERDWNRDARTETDVREWLRDYDGWDLPGYCCVEWHCEPTPRSVTGQTAAARSKKPTSPNFVLPPTRLSRPRQLAPSRRSLERPMN